MKVFASHVQLFVCCVLLISTRVEAQNFQELWRSPADVSAPTGERMYDMVLDGAGDIYLTGDAATNHLGPKTHFHLAKYDSQGTLRWSRRLVGPGGRSSFGRSIALDPQGNVVVAGYANTKFNQHDGVVAKYDSNGNQLWLSTFDGVAHGVDRVLKVAVSPEGDIAFAGLSQCPGQRLNLTTAVLDSEGDLDWYQVYDGGVGEDEVSASVAFDPLGDVVVAGHSPGPNSTDIVTIKYRPDGETLWIQRYDGPAGLEERATDMAVDDAGNVFVTGTSESTNDVRQIVVLGYDTDGTLTWLRRHQHANVGLDDSSELLVNADSVYVVGTVYAFDTDFELVTLRLNRATGAEIWAAQFGESQGEYGQSIALDSTGNILVTGRSTGPGTGLDFCTVKYTPNGSRVWAAAFNSGNDNDDAPVKIALDSNDRITIAGDATLRGGLSQFQLVQYQANEASGLPVFTRGPLSRVMLEGGTLNLNVSTTGNQPITLQWFFNNNPMSGETNADFTLPSAHASDAGRYWVLASNSVGAAISPTANINIAFAPVVLHQPDSVNLFREAEVDFRVIAEGTPPLSYQWLHDGQVISGAHEPTFFIPSLQPEHVGNYSVVISNEFGSVVSQNAALDIIAQPVSRVWLRQTAGGGVSASADFLATDEANNLCIAGAFTDANYRDGGIVEKRNPDGHLLWSRTFASARINDMTCGNVGKVYICGMTNTTAGNTNWFVTAYDAHGNVDWHHGFSPSGDLDFAQALTLDADGALLVAGQTRNPTNGLDFLVVKYSASGALLWTRTFNRNAASDDRAYAVVTDPNRNIYVTGDTRGNGLDILTVAYDPSGNTLWSTTTSGPSGDDRGLAALIESGGDLIVGGEWDDQSNRQLVALKYDSAGLVTHTNLTGGSGLDTFADLGLDSLNSIVILGTTAGASNQDILVAKWTPLGTLAWTTILQGPHNENDEATGLAIGSLGDIFVSGTIFQPSTDHDLFLAKLTTLGDVSWIQTEDGPIAFTDRANAIALDASEAIYIGGSITEIDNGQDLAVLRYGQFSDPSNLRPVVDLEQPRNGQSFLAPANIVLDAFAQDSEGPIDRVEFYSGDTLIGAAIHPPYLFHLQNVPAGEYVITARAFDQLGRRSHSRAARIKVLGAASIITPPTGLLANEGQTVVLDPEVSGTGLRFQWRLNGVAIDDETNRVLTIVELDEGSAGSYTLAVANGVSGEISAPALVVFNANSQNLADNFDAAPDFHDEFLLFRAHNTNATAETSEPNHAGRPGGKSVWFTWTPPVTGLATIHTRGSSFDTILAVYTGDALANLVPVVSDDDRDGFGNSRVAFNATQGVEYHVALDGYDGASGELLVDIEVVESAEAIPVITTQPQGATVVPGGSATLSVAATSPTPIRYQWFRNCVPIPGATNATLALTNVGVAQVGSYLVRLRNLGPRDVESDAALIHLGLDPNVRSRAKFAELADGNTRQASSLLPAAIPPLTTGTAGSQTFSTHDATTEAGEPLHCGSIANSTHWITIPVATNGSLRVDTIGSDFDTILAVYTGGSFATFVQVACDENSAPDGISSQLVLDVVADTTYHVVVAGRNNAQGTVQLNWQLGNPPNVSAAPVGFTDRAGSMGNLAVTASGDPAPGYQWQFNGLDLAGETNASLSFASLNATNSGLYTIGVSNAFGSTNYSATLSIADSLLIRHDLVSLIGGSFQLNVTNLLGRELIFQYTTNMGGTIQWFDLDTNSPASGSHQFSDSGAGNSTRRFYRIKEIAP